MVVNGGRSWPTATITMISDSSRTTFPTSKSLPPSGVKWWAQDYLPTRAWIMELVAQLVRALCLDRPVFMGC